MARTKHTEGERSKRRRDDQGESSRVPEVPMTEEIPESRFYQNLSEFENFKKVRNYDITPLKCWDIVFLRKERLELYDILKKLKLVDFVRHYSPSYYPSLTRMFYANLKKSGQREDTAVHVKIKGVLVDITIKYLAGLFEMNATDPCKTLEADKDYSKTEAITMFFPRGATVNYNKIQITGLSVANRLLHFTIAQILLPRKSNFTSVTDDELYIMWCIRKQVPINFPYLIINHMFKHAGSSKMSFCPYGMILAAVFEKQGFNLNAEVAESIGDAAVVGEATLRRMHLKKVDGFWVRADVESGEAGPSGSTSADKDLQSLETRFDDRISGLQSYFEERITGVQTQLQSHIDVSMASLRDHFDAQFSELLSRFPPPPPIAPADEDTPME